MSDKNCNKKQLLDDPESGVNYGSITPITVTCEHDHLLQHHPCNDTITTPPLSDHSYPELPRVINNDNDDDDNITLDQAEAAEGPFPVDIKSMLIAEVFGTCLFVQTGIAANCVSLYIHHNKRSIKAATAVSMALGGLPMVAMVWAIGLTVALYVAAPYSGGHFNPAVTLSFAMARPSTVHGFQRVLPYLCAQLVGAMLAAIMDLFLFYKVIARFESKHKLVRGGQDDGYVSAAAFADYWSLHDRTVANDVHAFFIEAFGTAILVFVIFALTSPKNPLRGPAIPPIVGATYGILVATLGGLTGAAFNPARDLGPRLVTILAGWGPTALTNFVPYLVGPLIGGPVGAFLADRVLLLR